MRSLITTTLFGIAFTVLAMTGDGMSQRIDPLGQQVTAGPHMPVEPMTLY